MLNSANIKVNYESIKYSSRNTFLRYMKTFQIFPMAAFKETSSHTFCMDFLCTPSKSHIQTIIIYFI